MGRSSSSPSIAGLKGNTTLGAYAISKVAEHQIARNVAVEYGPKNIRANAIAPGLIKTDFAKALWTDPVRLEGVNNRAAASAYRRPGRNRIGRRLPGQQGGVLCHRAGHQCVRRSSRCLSSRCGSPLQASAPWAA